MLSKTLPTSFPLCVAGSPRSGRELLLAKQFSTPPSRKVLDGIRPVSWSHLYAAEQTVKTVRTCFSHSLNPSRTAPCERSYHREQARNSRNRRYSVAVASTEKEGSSQTPLPNPDVIVVLAGGFLPDGSLPIWVERRLDEAARLHARPEWASAPPRIIVTGGGSPHKPPVLAASGQVVHEATACALYLISKHKVDPGAILKEWASYDTIGNAYYTLTAHIYPTQWRKIAVITSDFHMPRSAAIFDWMADLTAQAHPGQPAFEVNYVAVTDEGIDPEVVAARKEREAASLATLKDETIVRVTTLQALHEWLHSEHRCYSVERQNENLDAPPERHEVDDAALRSY